MGGSRRAWGWHQLRPRWAEQLVDVAGVGPGDLVLDVGAGLGALTAPLLASGARVIAVERHPGRAAQLRSRFGADVVPVNRDAARRALRDAPVATHGAREKEGLCAESSGGSAAPRLIVVETDAADLRLPVRPFHVVANPPFAITSTLLRRLVHAGSRLRSAHLVVQDQAARRWAAADAPGARRWQRTFAVEIGPVLPASAFRPPPHIRCRVLVIRRR